MTECMKIETITTRHLNLTKDDVKAIVREWAVDHYAPKDKSFGMDVTITDAGTASITISVVEQK